MAFPAFPLVIGIPAKFLPPDNSGRYRSHEDHERGGVALNDPSQGLAVANWKLRYEDGNFFVSKDPYSVEVLVISDPGENVKEVSLAFDQNMRPTIVYSVTGRIKLYWYDSFIEAPTTTTFNGARSPFITMDNKLDSTNTINDILLFYIRGGTLYYREQRDRFNVERAIQSFAGPRINIRRCGMNTQNRIGIEIFGADANSRL